MSRLFSVFLAFWVWTAAASAQEFSGLARVDAANSRISDSGRGGVTLDLGLSQGVPYRLFTLDGPPRLVADFQEIDWSGVRAEELQHSSRVRQMQFGTYVPGWSRMVLELSGPMAVRRAGLTVDEVTGRARLQVSLDPVSAEAFATSAGAPRDPRWDLPDSARIAARPEPDENAPLVVVIDPGHGGIDPGAETDGIVEKDMMMTFARELREALLRAGGFEVVLTRDGDHFVSLERRVALAHQAEADVFISLHADSLSEGLAHGATVHVLSREASDVASAKLAERHDRDDLLAGVDLSGTDDEVTDILLDLARQETQPRTEALARALVAGMQNAGGPMNRRPVRSAAFSVLKAADIPSVLIEIGFLSSPRDLKNLQDADWRAGMARGIRAGLENWRASDLATRPLVRQ
ncbi:N-acetylmuramoyl-L-alanine amidase [Seohaeicola saemankumensis]|nr:N-acetylmuramoyl-L-alanine amidase [Seohaeicola saemankumensis]MCA0870304.1 N-acetylmuramoyl-L-alanine amidase [Seohaeicola saemankumensis]